MRESYDAMPLPDGREYFEPNRKEIKKAEKTGVEQLTLREQLKDQAELILQSHGAEGELTPEVAAVLIESNGKTELKLDRLEELNEETAKVLAGFPGTIYLDGLKSLSDGVARAFFPHTEKISLNGVAEFSPTAAKALASRGAALEASPKLKEAVAEASEPQSF